MCQIGIGTFWAANPFAATAAVLKASKKENTLLQRTEWIRANMKRGGTRTNHRISLSSQADPALQAIKVLKSLDVKSCEVHVACTSKKMLNPVPCTEEKEQVFTLIAAWTRLKVEKKTPSNHNSNRHIPAPRAKHQLNRSTNTSLRIELPMPCKFCMVSWFPCHTDAHMSWLSPSFPNIRMALGCSHCRCNPLADSNPTLVLQLCHSQTCWSLLQPFFGWGAALLRKIPRADRWHCRHRFPACSAVLAKSWELAMNCTYYLPPKLPVACMASKLDSDIDRSRKS